MRDYYASKQNRLMNFFDFTFRPIKKKLKVHYGEEYAENIVARSRQNSEEIITPNLVSIQPLAKKQAT